MHEPDTRPRRATLADTVERIRSERFPHVDRNLVLEVLRLHADRSPPDNLGRLVDEAIVRHEPEQGRC